jgi:hypothetical protein
MASNLCSCRIPCWRATILDRARWQTQTAYHFRIFVDISDEQHNSTAYVRFTDSPETRSILEMFLHPDQEVELASPLFAPLRNQVRLHVMGRLLVT